MREQQTDGKQKRSLHGYAGLTLRGICMDAADIMLVVSGGTIVLLIKKKYR